MLELGKKTKKFHKELSNIINKSDIDKVFVYGKYIKETFKNLKSKNKKGKIFNNLNEALYYFSKIIHNNDLLMVKGSNATGLNQFSKNIKKEDKSVLYNFLISLVDQFSALNVFRYLTFRTGLSVMSSMIIVFLIGGPFIKFIENHKITGPIRDDGPIDHIVKKVGTPTMGGFSYFNWNSFWNFIMGRFKKFLIFGYYYWLQQVLVCLGAIDDYLKIKHKNSRGISSVNENYLSNYTFFNCYIIIN